MKTQKSVLSRKETKIATFSPTHRNSSGGMDDELENVKKSSKRSNSVGSASDLETDSYLGSEQGSYGSEDLSDESKRRAIGSFSVKKAFRPESRVIDYDDIEL
mmetsp:Transcript_3987/g.5274  ORF Transcript_3987/g.5274 Transcript_3987/m.5274 type:complete len:103 (+) Transcript_3987:1686-1994(+)|eukprot:CAMPEP_0185570662 /NCGR_PEP_ID=MMETSP0434-20130131/2894_1 /TAXON_ID=626734 ORGANISM="Favella taraikaensis, Strain Fe Narragansett Bay" /NCGR_SAMPLE_ID=MMETSP0434 /ASSEMBLY_ACC=CAM_ASM_000379 /LENGTH=102 /DNA_ID=CAMNT_0028185849 /DNA_START=1527 /DNA_END=1835 /DNA_ORIENTATION=-